MWGEETHTLTDYSADNFDMHIASVAVKLAEGTQLILGRHEVATHEHRLIGTVGWAQQARSFDGALLNATGEAWDLDAGAFVLTAQAPRQVDQDGGWGFLRSGWKSGTGQIDAIYILLADDNISPVFHTAGAYAKAKRGPVSARVEGYGQFGEDRSAWMAGISATYAPEMAKQPKATLWYDYLSGDPDPQDDRTQSFDTLFATNHKFYGLMDVMWFTVGAAADGQGLQDAALKLAMKPSERLTTKIDLHLFLAPNPVEDKGLGEELDFTLVVHARRGLKVGIGTAVLARPNRDLDSWSFVQLDAKL
jgi:hypothetical protein